MTAYRPNERICTICGNPYRIYGRIMCRECEERVNGRPLTFVERPPMPPDHGYGREDYIDETWCALCGFRTEGAPCPRGCPSEFV